ncbi:MAG TPA: M14 family metallopeptidase [Polyangiaceae bacterium]|nr:M14 family metallopeptidase [Polyangiaceae bacterium]
MGWLPPPWHAYPDAAGFEHAWDDLAREAGARAVVAGLSVEGRAIRRFEFGRPDGAPVLLTGLVHGVELVGSVALLEFVRAAVRDGRGELLRHARLVVLPVVNPDALDDNCARIRAGRRAYRRCNARGVDLNRNFPRLRDRLPLNPLGGSRWRRATHYVGPHPLSEPETSALRDVVDELRPRVSVGFHSFGELLLYPWAFTARPNPRRGHYERAGRAFVRALRGATYRVMQATQWYSTVGDLDDWLDAAYGTLAFTVEVSRPMLRLSNLRRASNPFAWANPVDVEGAVYGLPSGVDALVREALAA